MYTEFARYYDRLMDDVPYEDWARFYAGLLEHHHIDPPARCIECACGTGNLTIPLARMGYQIVGVDLSEDMLNIAQQKARKQGVMIPFVHMDMRKLTVQRPVDAILATCDGVNYLTDSSEAIGFFRTVYKSLKPGGVFVFDVSTPYKLAEKLGNAAFSSSQDDLVYIWQGDYHKSKKLFSIHLDLFVLRQDGNYERIEEDQLQRAHDSDELNSWLQDTGFSKIEFYGDRSLDQPSSNSLRWHIVAYKGV